MRFIPRLLKTSLQRTVHNRKQRDRKPQVIDTKLHTQPSEFSQKANVFEGLARYSTRHQTRLPLDAETVGHSAFSCISHTSYTQGSSVVLFKPLIFQWEIPNSNFLPVCALLRPLAGLGHGAGGRWTPGSLSSFSEPPFLPGSWRTQQLGDTPPVSQSELKPDATLKSLEGKSPSPPKCTRFNNLYTRYLCTSERR